MGLTKFILATILLMCGTAFGDWDPSDIVPVDQRNRMRNPDGSCVQCSIAIAGIHHINKNAEMLLWDSEFGPAERGGSWYSRVEQYSKKRNLEVWNIEGPETMEWIEWALSTNRYAAIGFDPVHFQTAVGMSKDKQTFYVVDNNSTHRVQEVTRSDFIRRHRASGQWCVILKGPAPPYWIGPKFVNWWDSIKPTPKPQPRPTPKPKTPKDSNLGFDLNLF